MEGPFRQFAWARFCLKAGTWQEPPTLGVLRARLMAAGDRLGAVTADVIIPELRNGEAHETLTWDGFAEHFLTDGVQIEPHDVVVSAERAQCFISGCEAGLTAIRFLDLPRDVPRLPQFDEVGRMPVRKRVQAFFGTNRLQLVDASLNTRHVTFRVERLGFTDVNPCFQALILAQRLMPNVEDFAVYVTGDEPTIAATAESLVATMSAWEFAVSNLDRIPIATFLPANLDARSRHEPASQAVRSVAWIAVDDAVGVIDGSPDIWAEADRVLIDKRLHLVELAVRCTEDWVGSPAPRLRSVAESVASLRDWVVDRCPDGAHLADCRGEMTRLRSQWEAWGPVRRHPLIPNEDSRGVDEPQPQLRDAPKSLAFRLL